MGVTHKITLYQLIDLTSEYLFLLLPPTNQPTTSDVQQQIDWSWTMEVRLVFLKDHYHFFNEHVSTIRSNDERNLASYHPRCYTSIITFWPIRFRLADCSRRELPYQLHRRTEIHQQLQRTPAIVYVRCV